MSFYKDIVIPFLDKRDSETWHVRARQLLALAQHFPFLVELFNDQHRRYHNPRLATSLGNGTVQLENPIGVGAGWDKVGQAMLGLNQLNFSHIEIGSVPPLAQPGNPKPRQFMFDSDVGFNRLGFNTPGVEVVAGNLKKFRQMQLKRGFPVGVSLGKNKDTPLAEAPRDHAFVTRALYQYADYFTLNLSSPNTPGLRKLQAGKFMRENIQAVYAAMDEQGARKPLLVKIAPDLTWLEIDDVIQVVFDEKATGVAATNTTNNPAIKEFYGVAGQDGGISGNNPEFERMSTAIIAHIYRETKGEMEIIGIGNVHDGQSAWRKITAGAPVLQVVTGIRGVGPSVAGKINRELIKIMDSVGIQNISEAVGINAKNVPF